MKLELNDSVDIIEEGVGRGDAIYRPTQRLHP